MLQLVPKTASEGVVHAGDVLEGRYRLQHVIGEGGMGTVFLAEHVLIKRRVAIKVLHRDLARDADVVERFMNEARAAGTLGHPNIVESTDMGFTRGDVPYIVFEYLEGAALSDEVYRLGGLTVRRALKIAHQIASALDAAHGAGIIHRDLKSDNVFLTDRDGAVDHVKVLDFGISRFLEAEQDRTGRGGKRGAVMMGTPEFMAPEQITTPERVDARTDVYALGVVLYEMLAARTPFVANSSRDPHELLHRILLESAPALARDDLPAGFAEMLFDKLLAKDPSARFQSMSDVAAALEAFIGVMRRDTQPIPADIVALPAPPPLQPATPTVRSRRRTWPLLVSALVAAAAGGVLVAIATPVSVRAAPDVAALDRHAEQLAATLDSAAAAAQLRADGIATSPVLRAAIETDSETLQDMARDGALFEPQPGEVLEIFQARGAERASLLRIPSNAPALSPTAGSPTLAGTADQIQIVVTAAVQRTNGQPGGAVALQLPLDARTALPRLADEIVAATLVGPGVKLALADGPADGAAHTAVVRTTRLGDLAITATLATPVVSTAANLLPAYACFGVAGLLLLVFVIGLIPRR